MTSIPSDILIIVMIFSIVGYFVVTPSRFLSRRFTKH